MSRLFRVASLAVLALGLTAMSAQAQKKTMGIVAGVDFATLNGSGVPDAAGSRTGFQGGLFYAIPVGTGGLAIEPEALYSMQGATFSATNIDGTLSSDYIKIPVLLKWSKNPGGKGVYVMAGPTVGFSVSCNVSGTTPFGSVDGSCESEADIKAKTTFSGDVGLGFSNGRFGLEGRYSWDWGNAYEVASDGDSLNWKNGVWSILLRFSK